MTASSVNKATKKKFEISFGGCGFLGVYHIGVGKCVVDHCPHLFDEFSGFYGASAGAITAVCAACKSDPMVPYKWVKKTFEASRKYKLLGTLHPSFDLYGRLRDFLEGFLPENAHKLCRNKVKISLTTFDGQKTLPERKNWLVSNFTTRTELINAIIASSFIPGYAGLKDLPKFRGKRCCDGGFTSNIPCCQDPNVITVSPFSGECDICPQGDCPSPHLLHIVDQSLQLSTMNIIRLMKALVPTSWTELEELFYNGYRDAYRFFKLEGIISESLIRPMRRRSTLDHALPNGASTQSHTLPTILVSDKEPNDDSSDYFSQCSETNSHRHKRHCSITVSTNGDFFSCIDEEREDDDVDGGGEEYDSGRWSDGEDGGEEAGYKARKPKRVKIPSYLRTLWKEMQEMIKEQERLKRQESIERQHSSSWSTILWLAQTCSPTRLPLVRSVIGGRGKEDNTEENCEHEEPSGILQSIASSWNSSMTVM